MKLLANQVDRPMTRVLLSPPLGSQETIGAHFFGSSESLAVESEERLKVLDPQALKPIGLTQRESEVLAWVAEGKSNNDVGLILGIRSVTVKKHLEHIFEKMGVETRTAAVAFAIRASRRTMNFSLVPLGYVLSQLLDYDLALIFEPLLSV
jgi:DNA-binding CsgD family transcriptional regulator